MRQAYGHVGHHCTPNSIICLAIMQVQHSDIYDLFLSDCVARYGNMLDLAWVQPQMHVLPSSIHSNQYDCHQPTAYIQFTLFPPKVMERYPIHPLSRVE